MTIVYCGSLPLMMQDDAMVELGWKAGQQIAEHQVRDAIAANDRSFCRSMDRRRAEGLDAPDTSVLAAQCGHVGRA